MHRLIHIQSEKEDFSDWSNVASSADVREKKMAGILKQTTNIAGLAVAKNPKYILKRCYRRILLLLEKMPEHSSYRQHTQSIINQRLSIINSTDDVKSMEDKIGCGQIEEVIIQAQNELNVAEMFLFAKPWESLVAPIPKNQWKWPIKN